MKVSTEVKKNQSYLKEKIVGSDLLYHAFRVGETAALLVFMDGLADKIAIGEQILRPLSSMIRKKERGEKVTLPFIEDLLASPETERCERMQDIEGRLLGGDPVLFLEGEGEALVFGCRKYATRAVAEPPTSVVVKGPREGFIEEIKTNLSLVRRRLKTPQLKIKTLQAGKYSASSLAVVYLEGVAEDSVVRAVEEKLGGIEIDGVIDSYYVEEFLTEKKDSLFKQVGETEKPDVFTAKLLEGRVGILVDGSPLALTVPYLVIEDFQSAEDYYHSSYRSLFSRLIRVFGVAFSVLLPAAYVMAQLFQLQLIPLKFLVSVVDSIKGIPFSPSFEMMLVLLIFEILNEASVRMPKYVGMALSVVGALVLGDTAVRAGLVSTPTVLIMALSGICLYTVPELVDETSVLRVLALIVAGTLGGLGLVAGSVFILMYALSLENFGTPLLAPYAPRIPPDLKDGIIKQSFFDQKERPRAFQGKNRTRLRAPKGKNKFDEEANS